jgi:serine/threonine-protein kinase HipA
MREALVPVHGRPAAILRERDDRRQYVLTYSDGYVGPPASLALPVCPEPHSFEGFPPFFDGLLPEGAQLEALLRAAKLDRHDLLGQLLTVGRDLVGAITEVPAHGLVAGSDGAWTCFIRRFDREGRGRCLTLIDDEMERLRAGCSRWPEAMAALVK